MSGEGFNRIRGSRGKLWGTIWSLFLIIALVAFAVGCSKEQPAAQRTASGASVSEAQELVCKAVAHAWLRPFLHLEMPGHDTLCLAGTNLPQLSDCGAENVPGLSLRETDSLAPCANTIFFDTIAVTGDIGRVVFRYPFEGVHVRAEYIKTDSGSWKELRYDLAET